MGVVYELQGPGDPGVQEPGAASTAASPLPAVVSLLLLLQPRFVAARRGARTRRGRTVPGVFESALRIMRAIVSAFGTIGPPARSSGALFPRAQIVAGSMNAA